MSHSSKISLVLLLIPIYNYCADAGSKGSKGVTFVPASAKKDAAATAVNSDALIPASAHSSTQEKELVTTVSAAPTAASVVSSDTLVTAVAVSTAVTTACAAAASSAQSNPVTKHYLMPTIKEQNSDYVRGLQGDGLRKLRGERAAGFTLRLIQSGKYASGSKPENKDDSNLPDHTRRAIEVETLPGLRTTSTNHAAALLALIEEQRRDNQDKFGDFHTILTAAQEYAPTQITPDTKNEVRDAIRAIIDQKEKLAQEIKTEFEQQIRILRIIASIIPATQQA